jgi:hypothetical protein
MRSRLLRSGARADGSQKPKIEGCSTRQIMRKVEQKLLPPPDDVINKRLFWWSDSIERYRRRAQADSPAARRARNPALRPRKPAQATSAT